ncbi:MAG: cobyrinate a,c-diamide synthase [Geobacteraceae bacterium]|nr:cobyrinate a,c-diamide synthase [Geobacteraceae bacterium]
MKSILIAAPVSGSGKTTITIGIMECLRRRGLIVAPFKVGPDFIDPGYHRLVTGQPSLNLDSWICPAGTVQEIFARQSRGADIAIIEGVMGLFDGFGGSSDEGSTAHIARLTGATVILVVNAKGFARSIAPLVKGFVEFDPLVKIGGVILNNVSSNSHARILHEALSAALPQVPVVGTILRDAALQIPSRHLGLMTIEDGGPSPEYLDGLAATIKESVDLGIIWALADFGGLLEVHEEDPLPLADVRIAVARDQAFCFVYESNLRLLRAFGAELVEFSPLRDQSLPVDIHGIYLPGGYPELHCEELAANSAMLDAIRWAIESGTPVYAECGGFIYLTRGVFPDEESELKKLAGIFPVATTMLKKRKALGYREIVLRDDSILGKKGTVARGHEFHYSQIDEMPQEIERLYQVRRGEAQLENEGYRYKNCVASYIHLHFGSNPGVAEAFVENCRKFKN